MLNWLKSLSLRRDKTSTEFPTTLPQPVDENKFLSASVNAALVDRGSGAYDKYLFGDKEIPRMPYEAAVDHHLDLMSKRLLQKFHRHLTSAERLRIRIKGQLQRLNLRLDHIKATQANAEKELASQEATLRGEKTGRRELKWIGEVPNFVSPLSAFVRIQSRYMIFVVIGLIDIYIIWQSLQNLRIPAIESAFLTAPAVAAQLVFPHLAGSRLSLALNGLRKKFSLWAEIVILLGVWGVFVYVIAVIRVRYIAKLIRDSGVAPDNQLLLILLLLNVILLTALGGWLIFVSIRENPHEMAALKLKLKINQLDRGILSIESKVFVCQEKFDATLELTRALQEELENSVESSRLDLGEAAKSIYRRALINEMGDPEFTKSYFDSTSQK